MKFRYQVGISLIGVVGYIGVAGTPLSIYTGGD